MSLPLFAINSSHLGTRKQPESWKICKAQVTAAPKLVPAFFFFKVLFFDRWGISFEILKSLLAKAIIKYILEIGKSRHEWLLNKFRFEA